MAENQNNLQAWLWYIGIIFVLLAVVLVGYIGFLYFATSVMGNFTTFNLLIIAVIAGIAVFFSPCSFPFIPVYLTKYYETKKQDDKNSPFILGLFAALGLLTFNILLGIAIAILGFGFGKSLSISGADPNLIVRWIRGIVGLFLVFVGFSHITGKGLNLGFLAPQFRLKGKRNPKTTMYSYGFLYTLIGIGCAGPILAGLSVFAFSTGGFDAAFITFLVYSTVMFLLMIFISLLASFSKTKLLDNLRAHTQTIKRITGIIVIVIGLILLWSAIFVDSFTQLLFP